MGAARSAPPISMNGKQPFKRTALGYHEAGWLPLPLPPGKKNEPPTGYTGWKADKVVTRAKIKQWVSSKPPAANIGARPQPNYVGVDVDLYKGDAAEQWAEIIADIGPLPDTWTSSARADGSGIRHYRLPEGYENLAWPGTVGDAIQFTHVGHRYPVLPPSRHPETDDDGNPLYYRWYEPGAEADGTGTLDGRYPLHDELTVLPVEVIEYFTKGRFARILPEKDLGSKTQSIKKVTAWIEEHDGTPCAKMLRVAEEITEAFEANAAHDTMRDGFYRLACLAAEGHVGLSSVASELHDDFLGEIRREGRAGTVRGAAEGEEEWLRARDSGVKKVLRRIDEGDFIGHYCTCGDLDAEGKPKPVFNVANYDFVSAIPNCYRALAASQLTGWLGAYNQGGRIMLRTSHGLKEANVDSMRSAVARATDWIRPGGDGPPQKAIPHDALLKTLLVDPELNTLPGLRYMTRSPFWALVDGKPQLVHENGYHAGPQVILDMDPELALAVANVDGGDFSFGLDKIEFMLKDFPFKGAADRANVYAALLLPYVRELIDGPTPLHLVHAPSPGSGKTLLCDAISKVVCGMEMRDRFAVALPSGRHADDEIRQLITTGLKQSLRVFVWDNVVGEVRSKDIAQVLTEPIYNARGMRTQDSLRLPNACLWLMNGNQFKANEDIRRRTVPIGLRALVKGQRKFDMQNFLEKNRKYIVWALLSMVQVWVDEGMPLWTERRLESYERYVEVIGGILAANGVPGFLANLADFNEQTTSDSNEYAELIEEWGHERGTVQLNEWYRVGDILNGLQTASEWVDSSKPGANKAMGAILTSLKDRPIGEDEEFLLQFKRPGNVAHYMLTRKELAKAVKRGGARRRVR